MDIEPAHIDQVLRAADGEFVEIDADVGGIAADLQQIDPGLRVRFAKGGPHWVIYHRTETGGGRHRDDLVFTVDAKQSRTGIWTGLDDRVVKRVLRISHSSYDYAAEVERQNAQARKAKRDRFREQTAEGAQEAFHALRKDLGVKSRAFIP